MNGNYGVVRGISTKMKLGFVVAWKVFTLAGVVMFTFFTVNAFFPMGETWRIIKFIYMILTPTWVGYLLIPVSGKSTANFLFLSIIRKRRFYRSFQK